MKGIGTKARRGEIRTRKKGKTTRNMDWKGMEDAIGERVSSESGDSGQHAPAEFGNQKK